MRKIVLGSTSIYRQRLLQKTGFKFTIQKPLFDEEAAKAELLKSNQSPIEIAEALSRGKALSVHVEDALIIAGDQLVSLDGQILGQSRDFDQARQQLRKMSGRTHHLISAVTLRTNEEILHLNHITTLHMSKLTDTEISNYLTKDKPFDCAGSYKFEESGLLLFERIETDDFSAIQGLPLLWITKQLKGMGYELFKE